MGDNSRAIATETSMMRKAAEALYSVAREHKQASAYHRRRSRIVMRSLSELKGICKKLGIELQIDGDIEVIHGQKQQFKQQSSKLIDSKGGAEKNHD